jgi:hypothetical protein
MKGIKERERNSEIRFINAEFSCIQSFLSLFTKKSREKIVLGEIDHNHLIFAKTVKQA